MNNFREKRKQAGIGLLQAAEHFAVTKQAVNAWERGENVPSFHHLCEMARYYECSIDELIFSNSSSE